jgi:23S rRNA (cytosine1962-C5)-methyltransferase
LIVLKPGKDRAILGRRHPWIYRGAIREPAEPPAEDLVPVAGPAGEVVAWGFYSPASLIAVRVVSFERERPAPGWAAGRIRAAAALRAGLGIDSDAFRLVNAEGDRLPGLIVDVYRRTTVVRPLVRGMEVLMDEVLPVLAELYPDNAIYLKRDERAARIEGLRLAGGYLTGGGDGRETIGEGGLLLRVDIAEGQKTGFYLDQRDNRLLVRRLARGRRVLNLFAYTGAFALQAAAGGAREAESVESSPAALELARESAALNPGLDPSALHWVRADVFEYLESGGSYDLIVLDPPPFARRRSEVPGAIKGYRQLNRRALQRLAPGGLLLSFTCSGAVSGEMLREVLQEEALQLGRPAAVIQALQAAPDHPWSIDHPEGEYLKGWLLYAS